MKARSDFWLNLHTLAVSLDVEGSTQPERLERLSSSFALLAPLARQEVARDLRFLLAELSELEPLILVQSDQSRGDNGNNK